MFRIDKHRCFYFVKAIFKSYKFNLINFIVFFSLSIQADPIKIMPMGDSITKGGGYPLGSLDSPSYRYYLFNSLLRKGWNVDFIGPSSGVSDSSKNKVYSVPAKYRDRDFPLFLDRDFAGNTGWPIDRFLKGKNSAKYLMDKYQPDIYLGFFV